MTRTRVSAALLGLICLLAPPAFAQDWPKRTVKIVVGFPAGTSTDIVARLYAETLKEHFKQPFIIENIPGTSSGRGAGVVAAAAPDGYTLFAATIANAIGQSVFKTLTFDLRRDFAPIAMVASTPTVLAVSPTLPVTTVAELIAYARTRPGEVFYASGGVGTAPQLVAELFNQKVGTKLVHVPYKGNGEAVADLLTGRVSLMFAPVPTIAAFLGTGQLKALATTSRERSPLIPSTPTFAELGFEGLDATIWYGLLAPKGAPPDIVKAVADVLNRAAADPRMKEQLALNGADPRTSTPEAFATLIGEEVAKWEGIVRSAGVKAE